VLSIVGPENVTRRVLKRFVTPLVAIAIVYLLGAVFVPLFGAVFADRIRPVAPHATIIAWVAGFLLYEWLSPTRILGVSDHIAPLFDGALGATLPAFLLAAAIRLAWPSR